MIEPSAQERPAKHAIAIGSGKGGVGKSTVTLNVALALSEKGHKVGILDADLYGPNIPLMVNVTRKKPARFWTLAKPGGQKPIEPLEKHGLKIMSSGFIVAEDQPIAWNEHLITALLHQLLYTVAWGDLDFLLIDLPPGTADLQQMLTRLLSLDGAVIVVTPQDVAHLDAKKAIKMFDLANVKILGGVENMSGLVCPHCAEHIEVFHPVADERSIWGSGVRKLGEIPLDPEQSRASDSGHPLLIDAPASSQADAFRRVADALLEAVTG